MTLPDPNAPQYPAGWLAINAAQNGVSQSKSHLIDVLRHLERDPSRAAQAMARKLGKIIGRLEGWQNAPKPQWYAKRVR